MNFGQLMKKVDNNTDIRIAFTNELGDKIVSEIFAHKNPLFEDTIARIWEKVSKVDVKNIKVGNKVLIIELNNTDKVDIEDVINKAVLLYHKYDNDFEETMEEILK